MGAVIFKGSGRRSKCISPLDRGFTLGDGIFETVKVSGGKAVWLNLHLKRLFGSALFAGIKPPLSKRKMEHECGSFIDRENISNGSLRITLSRGESTRFSDLGGVPTLVISGKSGEGVAGPAKAAFAPWTINETDPAVRHKTLSRFSSVVAWRHAVKTGHDELVFLNSGGKVAEGIVSNIFWYKGNTLFTPSENAGILPGIARGMVIKAARKAGFAVRTGEWGAPSFRSADGIFFTNSLWIIRPCLDFEGRRYQMNNRNMEKLASIIDKEVAIWE